MSIANDLVKFPSGATSTKAPRFDLIPYHSLVALADRFELGLDRHKDSCWNAQQGAEKLKDKEFVEARITHVIFHALKLREKLAGRLPDNGDDDAGAIAWGGVFLSEVVRNSK